MDKQSASQDAMLSRRATWLLGFISISTLGISLWKEMQFLGIAALATLLLALSPRLLQNLVERLEEISIAGAKSKFRPRPMDEADEALKSAPEEFRAKAREDAEKSIQRLESAMGNWSRFANQLRAEIAALGVRTTVLEEMLGAVRSRMRVQHEYKGYGITLESERLRNEVGNPNGWKPRARVWGGGEGDSLVTVPLEPGRVQTFPTKQQADEVAFRLAREWIDARTKQPD